MTTRRLTYMLAAAVLAVALAFALHGRVEAQGTGTTNLGSLDLTGTLVVDGNVTLGDAGGDTVTITGDITLSGADLTLGTTTATGSILSPFTPTGGVDTFLSLQASGAASATDILLRIGDSGDSTEHTFFGDGNYTADGTITGTAGAFTGAGGVALGAGAVTGAISSAFTLTGGADVLLTVSHAGNPAAGDTLMRWSDSGGTLGEVFGDGGLTMAGLVTGTGGVTSTGTLTADGVVVLGDGGDAFSVASTGLDVSAAGAVSNATTVAATGTISTTNGSVTSADADGFNGAAGSLVSGVPTVRFDIVAGTTGAQDLILDNCEAGSAATWTPGGAVPPVDADDAVTFRVGAGAVSMTFGDVGVGNATDSMATGGAWDASGDEFIYLWIRSTAVLSAGTLTLTLDDDTAAPDATVNVPAVGTANQWTLVRADISAVADVDKNVVSDLIITSNHATELDSAVVHFDQFVKMDNAESTALGFNAVNQPAIRSAFSFVEDAGNGSFTALIDQTDYLLDYTNDRVYFMTDQSANNCLLLYASSN